MVRRLTVSAALVAFLACAPGGPGPTPVLPGEGRTTPRRTPAGGPVLAIGDSLLVGADRHGGLAQMLVDDGWEPEVIAEEGRSVRWAIARITDLENVPRRIVVVLGSNPGFSSDGFATDVQELRTTLVDRGARRILWVPPHHPDPERYAEKVRILIEADRGDRRLTVPDWGAVLDANPYWVSGDGVHLYETGYISMAQFIRDELARIG